MHSRGSRAASTQARDPSRLEPRNRKVANIVRITSDWHIHSRNSCDQACLVMADLVKQAAGDGITDFGVTDHLHTPCNLPDMQASRAEYLSCAPGPGFHFGIELSVVSQWELEQIATGNHGQPTYGLRQGGPPGAPLALGVAAHELQQLGVEYVVGGAHWPMYVPFEREAVIQDYHRQNMFLATHALVDIVAHPWWWMGHWQDPDGRYTTDPWLDDFGKVPQSMHEEFAAAAVQHDTAVEANIEAILLNRAYPESFAPQYLDYLAMLRERGVRLSIGSDCHSTRYAMGFEATAGMLETIGLRDEDLWTLPRGH